MADTPAFIFARSDSSWRKVTNASVVLRLPDFDHLGDMDDPTSALLLMMSSHFLQFPYCAITTEQSHGYFADDVNSLSLNCSSNWRQRRH